MHDLVIRGGHVVDGTGSARRTADVAIDGARVTAIGCSVGGARRIIDADGLVVAPGFIDVHTHLDVQGFWDTALTPSPLHGVTTVVGGNCGFSVAPLDREAASYLLPMLARVEGMPVSALESGVPWDWTSTADYLDRLRLQRDTDVMLELSRPAEDRQGGHGTKFPGGRRYHVAGIHTIDHVPGDDRRPALVDSGLPPLGVLLHLFGTTIAEHLGCCLRSGWREVWPRHCSSHLMARYRAAASQWSVPRTPLWRSATTP
ncbi:MAG: amidohydrolase family protein [Actinomycetota bacterium]|nr:amidohydrolase family protein [Actinomycetota bacterium]